MLNFFLRTLKLLGESRALLLWPQSLSFPYNADAAKSKIEIYHKVKDTIKQDREALKAAQTDKEAKALIEKFAFTG